MLKRICKMLKNKKGFSLIELIVVIAILGVLAGIAAPNIMGAINKSRINADLANATTIANSILQAMALSAKGAPTGNNYDKTPVTDELDWLIPEPLSHAPQVRLGAAKEPNFYFEIKKGKLIIYAKTGDGKNDNDYTQLYPTPDGGWKSE